MKKFGLWITLILGIVFAAIMYTSTRGLRSFRVEVCINYQGRSACRTASGATEEAAMRTARDNACAMISSGMTDSIACQNTPPSKVAWLEKK